MLPPGRVSQRDRLAALLLIGLVVLGAATLLLRRTLDRGPAPALDPRAERDAVMFDRFSARRERSEEGDRLSITLRLRTSAAVSLPCYVFIVARSEQGTPPRRWAIWPLQPPGAAITGGGHFHGATPTAGYALTLSDTWERVTATIPHPAGADAFDAVTVYVVDPGGRILLARPFRI